MKKNIALSIKNLSFTFSKKEYFFKNLEAEFEAHKIHFICGQNAVGKSTFFRILQGNINKNEEISGQINLPETHCIFKKNELHNLNSLRNYIRMVPQKFDRILASEFSFIQNLTLANAPYYPNLGPLPSHQPIPNFIKKFNIDVDKPVKLLSGGQRQILTILMMLQKTTKVLLLDEPTAALDNQNAKMAMNFLAHLVKTMGLTVLIICHDKELIQQYAEKSFFEIVLDNTSGERIIKPRETKKNKEAIQSN